jgi:hypothetical protein
LTSDVDPQLRHATDTNSENDNGTGQGRGEQCHGAGHLPTHRKEVDAHVVSILSDEIDKGDAKKYGDKDRRPRGGDAGMTEPFGVAVRASRTVRPTRLFAGL